jgi:hypothetical protein
MPIDPLTADAIQRQMDAPKPPEPAGTPAERLTPQKLVALRPCLPRVGEQQRQVGVTVGQPKAAQVDEARHLHGLWVEDDVGQAKVPMADDDVGGHRPDRRAQRC